MVWRLGSDQGYHSVKGFAHLEELMCETEQRSMLTFVAQGESLSWKVTFSGQIQGDSF